MKHTAIYLTALLYAATAICSAETAPIQIETGRISGSEKDGVRVYKGIPFAASTAGSSRFRPPQSAASWEGVRACTEFGPECPQSSYPADSMFYRPPKWQSEDCLSLNIWTAAKDAKEKRPVMVWIHGGALTRGSGANPVYDGTNLAKKGVVLVTINYRLGPLGYLTHPELTAESDRHSSGNYGVLDQIAALKWLQKNIAAFGGDPSRVTIFGESAGSFSVNVLVASPLAAGLFHRAIGESGGVMGPMTKLNESFPDRPSAEEMGNTFAKAAGVNSLAELRALPVEQILKAADNFPRGSAAFRSAPNVDGWVLPDEIRNMISQGKHNDVPTIVGSNAKEMTSLTPPALVPKTIEGMLNGLKQQFGDGAAELEALYPAKSDAEAANVFLAVTTDRAFTVQMRAWARAASKGKSPAYWYYFTQVPPVPNKEYLGAFHAAEIAYAFNNVRSSERPYGKADWKLSDLMSDCWVNFAKTGDPNGKGIPAWKPYTEVDETCLLLGDKVEPVTHLLKAKLDTIEKLLEKK